MKVILILFFILLLNCSTQIVSKNHGISSLDKKYNKITIKESNKNDIIELIGPPSVISMFDENTWFYIERKKTNQSLSSLGKKKIQENQEYLVNKKKESQPTRVKTCGSTFKNPINNKKAWELINISGCANLKIGGASISEKHNNFFINNGSARSSDIETLIHKVRETVFKKTGIKLELELKIIGNK